MDTQESPDDVPRDPPTPVDLLLPGAWRTPRPDRRAVRRPEDAEPLAPPPPVVRGPSTLPLPLGEYFDEPSDEGRDEGPGDGLGADPGADPAAEAPFWERGVRAPVVREPSPLLGAPAVVDLRPFDATGGAPADAAVGPAVIDLRPFDAPATSVPRPAAPADAAVDVLVDAPSGAAPGELSAPLSAPPAPAATPAPLPPLPEWTVPDRQRRVSGRAVLGVATGLLLVGGGSLAVLLGGLPDRAAPAATPGTTSPAAAASVAAATTSATTAVTTAPSSAAAVTSSPAAGTTPPTKASTTKPRTTRPAPRTTKPRPAPTTGRAGQVQVVGARYVGRPVFQVSRDLTSLGLRVQINSAFRGRARPGTVLAVLPQGWVPVGSTVRLVVAF